MSTPYGGGPGYGGAPASYGAGPDYGGYRQQGKVDFGWIGESWSLFSANAWIWILAVAIVYVAPQIVQFLVGLMASAATRGAAPTFGPHVTLPEILMGSRTPPGFQVLSIAIGIAWKAFFFGGVYRMAVMQVRGVPIAVADIFSGGPTFVKFLVLALICELGIPIATCFCIFPGLILAAILIPVYALAADGYGLSEALSASADGMKVDLWTGCGFVFVWGLMYLGACIPCFLGLLAVYPMGWIISALAYRDMVGFPGAAPTVSNYGPQQTAVWPPPPDIPQGPQLM